MMLCAHKEAGAMLAGSSPVRRRDGAGAGFVIVVGIKQMIFEGSRYAASFSNSPQLLDKNYTRYS
jgi:hypothetical protein